MVQTAEALRVEPSDVRDALLTLLERRRSASSSLLTEPGPSPDELRRLLTIGVRVPDHGILEPWRLMLVTGAARQELSGKLAEAYIAANRTMEPERLEKLGGAISRVFTYAPLVIVVVRRPDPKASIPVWEQELSAGAVCMNLLTAAHALGYGAVWLSGWSATHPSAHPILGLASGESVAGFIHVGTPKERAPERRRPDLDRIVTHWSAPRVAPAAPPTSRFTSGRR
jgi:nitroreductase